jgi:hypothetical protein
MVRWPRSQHPPQIRGHRLQPADGEGVHRTSNFSPSGEAGNGGQLIMIDDPKIATAYAIEAVRVFDHLQFRDRMRGTFGAQRQRLAKATAPKQITPPIAGG